MNFLNLILKRLNCYDDCSDGTCQKQFWVMSQEQTPWLLRWIEWLSISLMAAVMILNFDKRRSCNSAFLAFSTTRSLSSMFDDREIDSTLVKASAMILDSPETYLILGVNWETNESYFAYEKSYQFSGERRKPMATKSTPSNKWRTLM